MSPVPTRQFGKGRIGIADVTVVGSKVHIVFEDNDQEVTVLLEDCPSYIRSGRQAVTLNSSNTEIYGARPIGGTHRAVFAGFTAREGEAPIIREVESRSGVAKGTGKKYFIKEHLEFTALFDIVSGKWKDYRIIYNLPYNFERYDGEDPEHPITLVFGEKISEFLMICGMDFTKDSIPWSENVLVHLEKLLISRKRHIAISLNDTGWVKDLGEIPDDSAGEETIAAGSTVANAPDPISMEIKDAKHDMKSPEQIVKEIWGEESKDTPEEILKKDADTKATKAKVKKEEKAEPDLLSVIAANARAGDSDSLNMLTFIAKTNPRAKEILLDIAKELADQA